MKLSKLIETLETFRSEILVPGDDPDILIDEGTTDFPVGGVSIMRLDALRPNLRRKKAIHDLGDKANPSVFVMVIRRDIS